MKEYDPEKNRAKRAALIEAGPFKPFYIKRSRFEGYSYWPEKNLADGIVWGVDEQMIRLETEGVVASLNKGIQDGSLTIEDAIIRPDWKPLTWFQENEPKLDAFDYYFKPEELGLSLDEKVKIIRKKEKNKSDGDVMAARFLAYMQGRDYFEVLTEMIR
jgi:hypothetical protein